RERAAHERRDRAIPGCEASGRRPVHALPRAPLRPAGVPARRPGARATHGSAGQELGQPVEQVGDPADPGPAVRLERGAARRGAAAARNRPRTGRRHRGAVLRRVVRVAAAAVGRVRGACRARFRPAVRALRLLLAVDRPVGGRLRPPLDRGVARPRWCDGGARRARPAAPEAPRCLGRRRHSRRRRLPAGGACTDRRRVEGGLLRFDPPQPRGRRPEHERDDRGGDRRAAGADGARPGVRARAAGDAPLPLSARGRRRAAHGRTDARRARSPARAGDRGRGRRPFRAVRGRVRPAVRARRGRYPAVRRRARALRRELGPGAAANARAAACDQAAARSARHACGAGRARRRGLTAAAMRILFQLASPAYVRIYGSTIRLLGERGHDVLVSFDDADKRSGGGATFDASGIAGIVPPLPPASRRYEGAVERLRATSDYLHYLDPRFAESPYLRRRLERSLDGTLRGLTRLPYGSRAGRAALAGTLGLERIVPADDRLTRALAGLRPDVAVISPLIGRSTRNRRQTDTVKSARRLGVPTVFGVGSWDHLTTKGVVKARPDSTLVWNDLQRRDAAGLHSLPRESVVVTGAQLFDPWFDRAPGSSAGEFAAQLGLPGERYVVYVGSSPNIAPPEREIPFVYG